MRNLFKNTVVIFVAGFLITSCQKQQEENGTQADAIVEEVRKEYAPDKRVALFNVETEKRGDRLLLKGESDNPEAVNSLKTRLGEQNISFTDSIVILPEESFKAGANALVKISVANLRSSAGHSSELATQATLGTPLKVLKKQDSWYLVQTPDKYLSWVDYGGLHQISEEEMKTWKEASKLIYTRPYGFSYSEANDATQVVSDLVAGGVLELLGEQSNFYQVKYPQGDTAYVKKEEAKLYKEWVESLDPSGENLIATSKSLMGIPYLWGGTSSKGVDCSGYTKTIFFLNGMIIPRDASQQIHTGKLVDSTRNFENLVAGDLLFFGRPATDTTSEAVIHVGMWIGDNKFIHSMGNVHISNMDPKADDFDEYNYNRYLRTKRVAPEEDPKVIRLANSEVYTSKLQ